MTMLRHSYVTLCIALLLAAPLVGCGDDTETDDDDGGGGKPTTSASTTSASSTADTSASTGNPMLSPPVAGISDCAADFVEADGVCRPSSEKCAPGTIPDVDVGCVPVGVTACAADWVDAMGVCTPDPATCDDDALVLPREGCVVIDDCGTGTWGNVVAAAGDVYVDPAYAGGASDGSREDPFTTLGAAYAVAVAGGRIVLAAGTYPGGLSAKAVRIEGVCTSAVSFTSSLDQTYVLAFEPGAGAQASLAHVTVTSTDAERSGGIMVLSGETIIEDVIVRDVDDLGIGANPGATATVRRVRVEHVVGTGSQPYARGLGAGPGGTMHVADSTVIDVQGSGLTAEGGTLDASNVLVTGTFEVASDDGSNAVIVTQNGTAVIEASAIVGNVRGLWASGANARLEVRRSAVADTTDPPYGDLVAGYGDADVVVEGSALVRGSAYGVYTEGPGSTDVTSTWIGTFAGGTYDNAGISAIGALTAEKVLLTNTVGAGITAGPGGKLTGIVVEGVTFGAYSKHGVGIQGFRGPVTIDRTYVKGAADYGIFSTSGTFPADQVDIASSLVEATVGVNGAQGVGIGYGDTMAGTIDATIVDGSHGAGIFVSGASVAVTSSIVRDVVPARITRVSPVQGLSDEAFAEGIYAIASNESSALDLTDVWIEGAERNGILLDGGPHVLTRVRSMGNAYGLAFQNGATTTRADCDFTGNDTGEVLEAANIVPPP